jgi:parallel beta-helix repeat protein
MNASDVSILSNRITGNDRSLNVSNLTCPGLPSFETAEDFDCGEGMHLTGVSRSTIANNTFDSNSGGILISDETGPTHDNLVSQNVLKDNVFDCGITIPSHPPAPDSGATQPFGVYGNTITGNESTGNGVLGEGAGIGLFAFMPGSRVSDNIIAGNIVRNNGLPGIAMHGHSPGLNMSNNVITGNQISGNGADTDDAFTPGPTGINIFGVSPIKGTVIFGNTITDEQVDVAVNTPAEVEVHQNNLNGTGFGVDNLGAGLADATQNWWGCSQGPNAAGCSQASAGVLVAPWRPVPMSGSPRTR